MLKELELSGFKSFAKKTSLVFDTPITAIVGPNGSGKSNVAEALRWVLGEQSMKSLRGKRGEDLIWNGSSTTPRQNRASVTIRFDNRDRRFNLDFEEVSITREVHRDGVNEYQINGSTVRLKDIYELLSQISLGASGHHIISQGEADRILNASPRERRSMIEDALGLKIFQYKKVESEKKLQKTEENMREAESLRREIAPHLRFLKKQLEQVERAEKMREELAVVYGEYFSAERALLDAHMSEAEQKRASAEKECYALDSEIERVSHEIALHDSKTEEPEELVTLGKKLREIRTKKDELSRSLGRVEGKLEIPKTEGYIEVLPDGGKRCRFCRQAVVSSVETQVDNENAYAHIEAEKQKIEHELMDCAREERAIEDEITRTRGTLELASSEVRALERSLYDLRAKRAEVSSALSRAQGILAGIAEREVSYKQMQGEAAFVLGHRSAEEAHVWQTPAHISADEERLQGERRHHIERLRIRIEDAGGGGEAVLKEYQETETRDQFLAREIEDLVASAAHLRSLMSELDATLEEKFSDGLVKINKEFDTFFALLFGGGNASLAMVREKKKSLTSLESGDEVPEEETEEGEWGITIDVSLTRKKVRSLDMLSGGERALTSIALLFAISQVNPPPFLVLDETDAALDEANSRKYGDIIERLSKHSQLILITHNRETMSRAHVLYGVTMSSDSVSKLLSIKFDEATAYAK